MMAAGSTSNMIQNPPSQQPYKLPPFIIPSRKFMQQNRNPQPPPPQLISPFSMPLMRPLISPNPRPFYRPSPSYRQNDINSIQSNHKPGMREVPQWLKSLRLHKYTALIKDMSYEEMMALDERTLEKKGVTKGARRKILQSLVKLHQRSEILRDTEKNLNSKGPDRCIRCAVAYLRLILTTPIRPYQPRSNESNQAVDGMVPSNEIHDQNIPALIFHILGIVNSRIFPQGRQCIDDIEDDYLLMLFAIFDRICANEAFTANQKHRVMQYKRNARKYVAPAELRRQRVGLPHSGKCDNCLMKMQEQMMRDGLNTGPVTQKQWLALYNVACCQPGMLERVQQDLMKFLSFAPPQLQQQIVMNEMMNQQAMMMAPWSGIGGRMMSPRPLIEVSHHAAQFPQYRSPSRLHSPLPMPSRSTSSAPNLSAPAPPSPAPATRNPSGSSTSAGWSHTIFDHGADGELNLEMNPWNPPAPLSSPPRDPTDSTSGYSSSLSERSSGAGSPPSLTVFPFGEIFQNLKI